MMRSPSRLLFVVLALAMMWPVSAQAVLGAARAGANLEGNPEINVQIFRPSPHLGDLPQVMMPGVPEHMTWSTGTYFSVGRNPFTFCKPDQEITDAAGNILSTTPGCDLERQEVITDFTVLDITGSLSLFNWVEVGVAIPIFVSIAGDFEGFAQPVEPVPGGALGDIRLSLKSRSWTVGLGPMNLNLGGHLQMGLPTGDNTAFVSDGFQIAPAALASIAWGPLSVGGNLGLNIRANTASALVDPNGLFDTDVLEANPALDADVEYIRAGSGLVWGAGAAFNILGEERALADVHGFELAIVGEVHGNAANILGDEEVGKDNTFSTANANNMEGRLGARVGLPDLGLALHVGGGSGWTKGYGNTKYRVYAGAQFSPPKNRDQDRDGLVDEVDACPEEPEDKDDFQDEDGCPEADNDEDGIVDGADRCPNDAEDKDNFRDADGCPEPDNDGDEVLDAADKCPTEAEDRDGFQDDDGCPDTDNDGDGVPDSADDCPDEAETKNGHQDTDGCPDESLAKLDTATAKIVILDNVYFALNKETIKPQSYPVLKAVAGLMLANPTIQKIRIEGHTDQGGGRALNRKLSQARAEAVKEFLVAEGIAPERMEAVGMGKEKPIAEGRTKEARSANRRVEFVIINE